MKTIEKRMESWVAQKRFCESGVSIVDLSEALGVTCPRIKSYFKDVVCMDFKTWRNLLRIEEAKCLLLDEPDMSAQMIGEAVGFGDRSNFHNMFVREVGCTPKEWRESGGNPSR